MRPPPESPPPPPLEYPPLDAPDEDEDEDDEEGLLELELEPESPALRTPRVDPPVRLVGVALSPLVDVLLDPAGLTRV